MDLLTVLAHELGHVIGHEHEDRDHGVMASHLQAGARALPAIEESGVRGQESGVVSQVFFGSQLSALDFPLSSSIQYSAYRIPHSASEVDSLFARVDDDPADATDYLHNEDHQEERQSEDQQDGLDLWTVLHGLE